MITALTHLQNWSDCHQQSKDVQMQTPSVYCVNTALTHLQNRSDCHITPHSTSKRRIRRCLGCKQERWCMKEMCDFLLHMCMQRDACVCKWMHVPLLFYYTCKWMHDLLVFHYTCACKWMHVLLIFNHTHACKGAHVLLIFNHTCACNSCMYWPEERARSSS